MSHSYKNDKDLEVLQYANKEMFDVLVRHLTFDKDGLERVTSTLKGDAKFTSASDDYRKVWRMVAGELQHFGGDTFANLVRGTGVPYKEILIDVCKKIKVKTDFNSDTIKIEQAMIAELMGASWEKMTTEEKEALMSELKIDPKLSEQAAKSALMSSILAGGFTSYYVSLILANSIAKIIVGKGLQIAATAGFGRLFGLLGGPVGWVISGLLTLPAISGPAFRVTCSAVIQVAAMRQHLENKDIF
jgi:uncharacterized protein YaaW (UPF0174 family)